jgi:transcriptional antiterminator
MVFSHYFNQQERKVNLKDLEYYSVIADEAQGVLALAEELINMQETIQRNATDIEKVQAQLDSLLQTRKLLREREEALARSVSRAARGAVTIRTVS